MNFLTKKWPFLALSLLLAIQLYAAPALGAGDHPNVSDSFQAWLLGIVGVLAVGAVGVAGRSIILLYRLEVRMEHLEKDRERAEKLIEKREKAVDEKLDSLEENCKRRSDNLWSRSTPIAGNGPVGD